MLYSYFTMSHGASQEARLRRELRTAGRAVERADSRLGEARERRRAAILAAHEAGWSYRRIAAEASLTFPAVQQIVHRERD